MTKNSRFPENFIWGAAMSDWQIEGAADEDGKGLSIWDTAARNIGESLDIACDHYHRYEEDFDLMREVGLQAYRLAVSWPRILPEGVGQVNKKGLDFYDSVVDALLERQIEPWIDLFHWGYPEALYRRGGWLNRESADWFADFVAVVVDRLSDRVRGWLTINEPQCFVGLGHLTAVNPPCLKLPMVDLLRVGHHALLAHGKGVQSIHAHTRQKPLVGAALVGVISTPATACPTDIEAARLATFSVADNIWSNTWYADPMLKGTYPEDGLRFYAPATPPIHPGDMETICQPLDFYGVNIYHSNCVRASANGNGYEGLPFSVGMASTSMKWPVTPEALYWGPKFLYERYKLPILITENGLSNVDWVHVDGHIHDTQRIDFITRYLREYKRAIADGVEAMGYFHWTFLDNYEWPNGYNPRFGLVYVNYQTQERILKESARWYKQIIDSNGAVLAEDQDSAPASKRQPVRVGMKGI